jgi:tetratricopeptide (TPR) repeat protein
LKNDNFNLDKAILEFTEAIRIRPFDGNYYLNRGGKYSKLKNHKKAVEDFSNAINYGSDDFKKITLIFHLRGNEYTELKDYEKAIVDFSKSILIRPDYIKSLLMRGNAYLGTGEKDKAKADFDEYLRKKREWDAIRNVVP